MKYRDVIGKVRDSVRVRQFSYSTEKTYVHWVGRFMKWLAVHPMPNAGRGEKIEAFLTNLAKTGISPSTQNQAFNALLFMCRHVFGEEPGNIQALRPKRRTHVRVPPPSDVVLRLLDEVEDYRGYPTRLICKLLYGCGLRVSEPLHLRVKDVLLKDMRLVIRCAKGGKDRVVTLPCSLYRDMEAQLLAAKAQAAQDKLAGIPISVPDRLMIKYRKAQFSEGWAFVFPSRNPMRHPREKTMMRWHVPPREVQRAVSRAAAKVGMEAVFSPHYFRHAYATHCLEAGSNPRDLQEAMGHKHLDTTMGYTHPEIGRVPSPLDRSENAALLAVVA